MTRRRDCFAAGEMRRRRGSRVLVPLEERVEPARRFTVIHAGRPTLIDHLLASPALAAAWRKTSILNEGLQDEVYAKQFIETSLHAPVVAELSKEGAWTDAPR